MNNMNTSLESREQILKENEKAHDQEAVVYEQAHPEIFGPREQARIREVISRAVKELSSSGRQALDIGCGTGTVTLKLLEAGFTVTALDISLGMLEELRKKLGENCDRVKLVHQDIDGFIENQSGSYDCITISSVLHHLPDYLLTLKKIIGLLAPGGVIAIMHEPVGVEGKWWLKRFLWFDAVLFNVMRLPREAQKIVFGIDYSMVDYQIGRGFSVDAVLETLEKNGCTILAAPRHSSLKFGWTTWLLNHLFKIKLHFACLARK